jgi:hypothetical protein
MKMISSLPLNVGRKTVSPYFRTNGLSTFKIADNSAFLIAGMQECKNSGMSESVTACYQNIVLSRLTEHKKDGNHT